MSKRVYKFLSAQYGIDALVDRRIKVSTLNDLNDPFDLLSIDTKHPVIEMAVTKTLAEFRIGTGLLCFSRNWDNLLMWSHYGVSHAGICLGFDIPDEDGGYDMDVHYQPNVLQVRSPQDVNFDLVNRLLRTKHESWSYEQESRIFIKLIDPADDKGLHWYDFGPHLILREVIVGAQCEKKHLDALAAAMKEKADTVECSWAYMKKDAFLLVRHDFSPPWFK